MCLHDSNSEFTKMNVSELNLCFRTVGSYFSNVRTCVAYIQFENYSQENPTHSNIHRATFRIYRGSKITYQDL